MKTLTWFWMLSLLCISAFVLLGCDEAEVEPVTATFTIVHGVADLGRVEVLVDGAVSVGVALNSASKTVDVDPGTHRLSLRASGASANLLDYEQAFEPQAYLFVLRGRVSDQTLRLDAIDEIPPTLGRAESAVEVVSLLEEGVGLDVYVDGEQVGDAVTAATPPSFNKTDAGPVLVEVYNDGSTPGTDFPVFSEPISLSGGHAYMLLLQPRDGETHAIDVDTLRVR